MNSSVISLLNVTGGLIGQNSFQVRWNVASSDSRSRRPRNAQQRDAGRCRRADVLPLERPAAPGPDDERREQRRDVDVHAPVTQVLPGIRIVPVEAARDVLGEIDEADQRPGEKVENPGPDLAQVHGGPSLTLSGAGR